MPIFLNLLRQFWYVPVIVGLFLYGQWWHHETKDVRKDLAVLQAQFDGFKNTVEAQGKQAKAESDATIAKSERVNNERITALQSSYSSIAARYDGLRTAQAKTGSGSGGGKLPAVPDAARTTDAAARDNQLLAVLEHAEIQTARLLQCQGWIADQVNAFKR